VTSQFSSRSLVILAALSISAASFASYELALIAADTKIIRYDPVNNLMLGSFGENQLGQYYGARLALSPLAPNEVHVLNNDGGVRKFDYSTGAYLGGFSAGGIFFGNGPISMDILQNGNYVINGYVSSQTSRIFSPTGTPLATMNPFGSNYVPLDSTVASDGRIYTLNRINTGGTSYNFYTFTFEANGNYVGFSNVALGVGVDAYHSVTSSGNKVLVTGGSTGYLNASIGSLGTSQTYTTPSVASAPTGHRNWAPGHFGQAHGIQSNAGVNRYYAYDPITNSIAPRWTMSNTDNLNSMVLVVAPEPTSVVALALGALLVLRKRKA